MLITHEYPIMEYDDNKVAKLNPAHFAGEGFSTNKLVITFFPEVMEKLKEKIKQEKDYVQNNDARSS